MRKSIGKTPKEGGIQTSGDKIINDISISRKHNEVDICLDLF